MIMFSQRASVFKKKNVSIVAVGVGHDVKFSDLRVIAGTKGKLIMIKDIETLMTRLEQILNTACGEWHFLFQFQYTRPLTPTHTLYILFS